MLDPKSLITGLVLISSIQTISTVYARQVAECGVVYVFKTDALCGKDKEYNVDIRTYDEYLSTCDKNRQWQDGEFTIYETVQYTADWGLRRKGYCTLTRRGACRRPEFGIQNYVDCDIKKTADELNEYIAQNKVSIANDGKDLLQFQSNFYSEEKNQIAMGCLISKYQADPIYSGVSSALVTQFENLFSRSYTASEYSSTTCAVPQASTLQSASCPDSDSSTKCANLRRYQENLHLLQTKKAEILDLKNDVVPRQNAAYAAELDALVSMMPLEVRN